MIIWKRKGEWMELALSLSDWNPIQQDAVEALEQHLRVPRKLFAKLLQNGGIKLQGNKLLLHVFPSESAALSSEYAELEILFEDDFCLVVNKPAGMSVHPAEKGQKGTLAGAVAYYYESTGQSCSIRHIHRLDRDTTGAVLYAKNEWAQLLLDEDMRENKLNAFMRLWHQGYSQQKKVRSVSPLDVTVTIQASEGLRRMEMLR